MFQQENFKLNPEIPKSNQVRFGINSSKYLDPKVWYSFLYVTAMF